MTTEVPAACPVAGSGIKVHCRRQAMHLYTGCEYCRTRLCIGKIEQRTFAFYLAARRLAVKNYATLFGLHQRCYSISPEYAISEPDHQIVRTSRRILFDAWLNCIRLARLGSIGRAEISRKNFLFFA
jgi:hypothetical protein